MQGMQPIVQTLHAKKEALHERAFLDRRKQQRTKTTSINTGLL